MLQSVTCVRLSLQNLGSFHTTSRHSGFMIDLPLVNGGVLPLDICRRTTDWQAGNLPVGYGHLLRVSLL